MNYADRFILDTLELDALPETCTVEVVRNLVRTALESATDKQSSLDEERIRNLRAALLKIEKTSTDNVACLTARQARIQDDD